MRQVKAADELGKTWIVYEEDPGWAPFQQLQKLGLSEVVLPRDTFLSGSLPPPDSIEIPDVPADVCRMSPDVRDIVLRSIRLKDCVTFLNQQEVAA